MTIDKKLCERLYSEVKTKLKNEFLKRGMTYRDAETFIWKAVNASQDKTYFQVILEETTKMSFSTTFNNMYLWRKMNEVQTKEFTNFQEDYLLLFVKFLGYHTIQSYIEDNSLKLADFLGLSTLGKTLIIQPIFEDYPTKLHRGEKIRIEGQTVDSKDTESLFEIINWFHQAKLALPERIYDRDIVTIVEEQYQLTMSQSEVENIDCIISIGFYSNHFMTWTFQNYISDFIAYTEDLALFKVKYYNFNLNKEVWTDYYQSNTVFDEGFLLRMPVKIEGKRINCFYICGIENIGTKAMTSYLCKHWASIIYKRDSETDVPIANHPFLMVFKINRDNLKDIYCEKIIVMEDK
jgi:hypothetical protein